MRDVDVVRGISWLIIDVHALIKYPVHLRKSNFPYHLWFFSVSLSNKSQKKVSFKFLIIDGLGAGGEGFLLPSPNLPQYLSVCASLEECMNGTKSTIAVDNDGISKGKKGCKWTRETLGKTGKRTTECI